MAWWHLPFAAALRSGQSQHFEAGPLRVQRAALGHRWPGRRRVRQLRRGAAVVRCERAVSGGQVVERGECVFRELRWRAATDSPADTGPDVSTDGASCTYGGTGRIVQAQVFLGVHEAGMPAGVQAFVPPAELSHVLQASRLARVLPEVRAA